MPDREKVIKGFELCLKTIEEPDCRKECLYYEACQKYDGRVIFQPLMRDALALLKEQEAVKPIPFFTETGAESPNYVVCGHCKSIKAIMPKHTKQKYCHECGFPVLWEGR